MTSPAVRKAPAPTCAPGLVGPCVICQQPTHRYGSGGSPLCPVCLPAVEARQTKRQS